MELRRARRTASEIEQLQVKHEDAGKIFALGGAVQPGFETATKPHRLVLWLLSILFDAKQKRHLTPKAFVPYAVPEEREAAVVPAAITSSPAEN